MALNDLKRDLQDLVTVEDLIEIFGRTRMTIYLWRRDKGLNEYEINIPGGRSDPVRFSLNLVLRWATRSGIETPGLEAWRARRKNGQAA